MIKQLISYLSLIGQFWHDRTLVRLFRWNVTVFFLELFLIILFFNNFPPQIPLFRSLIWGESQLAPPSLLFLLPIFSITVILINSLLAFIFQKNQLLTRLLIATSFVFSLLSLVPIIKTITLFP